MEWRSKKLDWKTGCDRAVSIPCHKMLKEQREKRNVLWWRAWTEGKPSKSPWMLISTISLGRQQGSKQRAMAGHTADLRGKLKERRLSSWVPSNEGSSTSRTSQEHMEVRRWRVTNQESAEEYSADRLTRQQGQRGSCHIQAGAFESIEYGVYIPET